MRNESTSPLFGCIVEKTKPVRLAGLDELLSNIRIGAGRMPTQNSSLAPTSRGDNFTPFYSYRVKPPSEDDEVLEKLNQRFSCSSAAAVIGATHAAPVPDVAPKPEYDRYGRPISTMVAHIPPVEPSCRVIRRKDREAERRAYRATHPDCPHPSGRLWSAGKGRKLCKLCGVKFRVKE